MRVNKHGSVGMIVVIGEGYVQLELTRTKEWEQATRIVNDWIANQLRPEGREGIYVDDEGALIYEITRALISAKEIAS